MALTACHECGKQISTTATSCPHCGAPVQKKRSTGCLKALGIAVLGLLIFSLIVFRNTSTVGDKGGTDAAVTVSVQTLPGGAYEKVPLVEATDQAVIDEAGQQVTTAGYKCESVTHLWKLNFSKDVGMKILKISCSDGPDFQVTILDHKAFVKPWTGTLMGN